jgi:hypothetical protein
LCCSVVCCIQGYILFATNLGFGKHGPLASSKAGEVFGNAAEAINQRKRYDQALTLFDDDTEEEHLAQKTSSTPLTKKSLNSVPAVAAPSKSAVAAPSKSAVAAPSKAAVAAPSTSKKNPPETFTEAVPQPIGKVAANKKRGAPTSASAVADDAAEDEAVSKKKVPRRKK